MATLIVCNIMSLDGYYADATGNPLVLPMDDAFDRHNLEVLGGADRILLGANSYRMFMGFWPAQATNPEAGETHRAFGELYGRLPVSVVSDSLTDDDVAPWRARTTVVPRDQAEAHVKGLSGTVAVFGSRITWTSLLAAGLVDQVHLVVGATVLGGGTPLFAEPIAGLTTAGVERLDGSDNVLLRYRAA